MIKQTYLYPMIFICCKGVGIILIIYNPMKTSRQNYIKKKYQSQNKSALIQNIFQIIKKKKGQSEEGEVQSNQKDCTLPLIQPSVLTHMHVNSFDKKGEESESEEIEGRGFVKSPIVNYRTVFQSTSIEEKMDDLPKTNTKTLDSSVVMVKINNKGSKINSNRIKSEHHEVKEKKKKTTRKTQVNECPPVEGQQISFKDVLSNAKQNFKRSLSTIPKDMKKRNEITLNKTLRSLEIFNPFFNRNHKIVNVCLLKVGRIVAMKTGTLYKLGEELPLFFIILSGKVKLINGNFKQICQTGETILEQILFLEKDKKIALEKAKAIGETFLLEISLEQFRGMKEEMIRHRFKVQVHQMESIIKRNFIVKNWLRNKARAEEQI